ncbi:HD domain-containing protein [Pelagibius sp. Alg239-R121]|uniref:HD domain-containing protein n=1 Tax=Pelagibius sp. Alg239-R121 TaxID=2993448 RepID=UPI0024A6B2CC|nr:peptidase [Pelagibius sp. Alg239-R121]
METVKFSQMKHGDREDYELLRDRDVEYAGKVGDRLLESLSQLEEGFSGFKVTRLDHSLQTATRAWWDGADADWVVAALLHDVGDLHAPYNHDEYAALVLRPFLREQCVWTVEVHADFQKVYYAEKLGEDPNVRDRYRGNPYFNDCVEFCARWDQASFDPTYDYLPLEFFRPLVRQVFARRANDPAVQQPGVRMPLIDAKAAAARKHH